MILRPIQLSLSILLVFASADYCLPQEQTPGKYTARYTVLATAANSGLAELHKLIKLGKLPQAEEKVRRHLKAYPHDADYLLVLARIQLDSGDTTAALNTLKTARSQAPAYEDIYLLEAAVLAPLETQQSCRALHELKEDYAKYTPQQYRQRLDAVIHTTRRDMGQVEVAAEYDQLSNNRGDWQAYTISNRNTTCAGSNFYAGYNTVNRYQRNDDEVFVGGGISMGFAGLEVQYRQSREVDILAKQAWSGTVSIHTDLSADLLVLGSRRKYDGLETRGLGLGVDYYIANYQFLVIGEEVAYIRDHTELDSSASWRYYLGYYFAKDAYLRVGYITGKELDNDGSPNPPYSRIETLLLSTLIPLTTQTGLFVELKRHHQSGYYEQNGIRLAIRYSYR